MSPVVHSVKLSNGIRMPYVVVNHLAVRPEGR